MEMHQLLQFLAVCETMNFTRAAERCHVAQPSLTRAIHKLEEELGGPAVFAGGGSLRQRRPAFRVAGLGPPRCGLVNAH